MLPPPILIRHHHKGQVRLSTPHYRVLQEPVSPPLPGSQCIPGLRGFLPQDILFIPLLTSKKAPTLSLLPKVTAVISGTHSRDNKYVTWPFFHPSKGHQTQRIQSRSKRPASHLLAESLNISAKE